MMGFDAREPMTAGVPVGRTWIPRPIGPLLVQTTVQQLTPTTMSTQKSQSNTNNPNNVGLGELNKGAEGQANQTDRQPGTKRQGAEQTRTGDDRQPGTQRHGAENTQMDNDRRTGAQRQGAENTQMDAERRVGADKNTPTHGKSSEGTTKQNPDPLANDEDVDQAEATEEDSDLDQNEGNGPIREEANTISDARK